MGGRWRGGGEVSSLVHYIRFFFYPVKIIFSGKKDRSAVERFRFFLCLGIWGMAEFACVCVCFFFIWSPMWFFFPSFIYIRWLYDRIVLYIFIYSSSPFDFLSSMHTLQLKKEKKMFQNKENIQNCMKEDKPLGFRGVSILQKSLPYLLLK